jgi:aminoglycoside phosphotransferase (APT) family kinase protein
VEDPAARAIARFVERAGLGRASALQPLAGGVSSDIWRVELASHSVCVKRALPRLRVAQVWEAPVERNRYERQWLQAARAALPSAAPDVIAWDDDAGLFAMEYLDLPVWKKLLAEAHADASFAGKVGASLAAIHAATANDRTVAGRFPTDAIFHAIRLEPYLLATARAHPSLSNKLEKLAARTASMKRCLVHGDVSPKNILVGGAGPSHFPIFLDAECAWYGDPAFDLAFCLNHLFLKSVWVPAAKQAFMACYDSLSHAYLEGVKWEPRTDIESRAATLLPGLLLARVDGKSPVEYLDASQQARVRAAAITLLGRGSASLAELRDAWQRSST